MGRLRAVMPDRGRENYAVLIWVYMAHKLGTDRPTKLIKTADFENSQAVFFPSHIELISALLCICIIWSALRTFSTDKGNFLSTS